MNTPRFTRPRFSRKLSLFDSVAVLAVGVMLFLTLFTVKESFASALSPPPKRTMVRPYGMPPHMYHDYIQACYKAGINPQRITQTIGGYHASAGTHLKDGTTLDNGIQYDYTCAVDLSTRDLSDHEIKLLLHHLFDWNFVGWYRYTGSFGTNRHIHMISTRYFMKRSLRNQVHAFFKDRTGLAGNGREVFKTATEKQKQKLRVNFLRVNPARN